MWRRRLRQQTSRSRLRVSPFRQSGRGRNSADYSRPFLADASTEEARAWHEHFSTRLEAGKASPKAGVREMVAELLELYGKATSQEAPTDGR